MGQRLTDTEALLWSLGRDPNLASTMGLVAMLGSRPDPERFRATMSNAVAAMTRLQHKVYEPSGLRPTLLPATSVARPEWVTDHQFDLDYHVRTARLSGSSDAELRRAAAQFVNDPFDRARPLWQFQLVTGLRGGRAAVLGKVHHSISDGIGLLRLAASVLEFEPDAPAPEPVDLTELLAPHPDADDHDEPDTHPRGPERWLGWLQHAADSIPTPVEIVEAGIDVIGSARALSDQLPKHKASTLWDTRSRNRRLEFVSVSVASLKQRAAALDATVNDVFVAAAAEAALRYHRHHEAPLPTISATIVVSLKPTPASDAAGGALNGGQLGGEDDNAFIPVAITVPGDGASSLDRLRLIQAEVRRHRAAIHERRDLVGLIGTLSSLVPSSLAASLALGQTAKVDFATSNIPGPPVPTWLAGQPVTEIYPVGPVAGTAFNVTLMTYDDVACLGIHLDPAAVTDGALLAKSLRDGFGEFDVTRC